MLEIVKLWVPLVYEAFSDYRQDAVTLSATALQVVRKMLDGEKLTQAKSGLSKREWRDLMLALERPDD